MERRVSCLNAMTLYGAMSGHGGVALRATLIAVLIVMIVTISTSTHRAQYPLN